MGGATLVEYARATREAAAARDAESGMAGAFATLSSDAQARIAVEAAEALRVHAQRQADTGSRCAACAEPRRQRLAHACCGTPSGATAAFIVPSVLAPHECDAVIEAVRAAATARGGWGSRHAKHSTSDLGIGALPTEIEALLRSRLFARVLRPLAPAYFAPPMLPEHLKFNDLFFVRYCCSTDGDGAPQPSLALHTDGSVFSFNLVLSDPQADFDGGGTEFEDGRLLRPPRGGAAVHSGQVLHGGAAIVRGERLLLVGFVDVEAAPHSARLARWAAVAAHGKFGGAAWQRSAAEADAELRLRARVWSH